MDAADVSRVPADVLRNVEADTYWCMSKLLDGIQVSPSGRRPAAEAGVMGAGTPGLTVRLPLCPARPPSLPALDAASSTGSETDRACMCLHNPVRARIPPRVPAHPCSCRRLWCPEGCSSGGLRGLGLSPAPQSLARTRSELPSSAPGDARWYQHHVGCRP